MAIDDDPRFSREWISTARELARGLRKTPLDFNKQADRALYHELHDADSDPTLRLYHTILCAEVQSAQLVAGFRGVGKTTEFSRLGTILRERDHDVVYVDLAEQIDLSSPVEVTEFLLLVAGAVGEALQRDGVLPEEKALELNFWRRLRGFRDAPITDRLRVRDPQGNVVAELDLQRTLRESDTYRAQIRRNFGGDLHLLRGVVNDYLKAVREALQAQARAQRPLVLIVDSLEHLRGRHDNAEDVLRSVRRLLIDHGALLQFEGIHVVYSVPAFLLLDADTLHDVFDGGNVRPWTALHVRHRDPNGALVEDRETVDRLAGLVEQRVDWTRFLADRTALDALILASGGYLRDLFDLLWGAVADASPVQKATPSRVIQQQRLGYPNLFGDDIELLRIIAKERDLRGVPSQGRDRVARFLDSHLVLPYLNGSFWYDVHPIVKDEVMRDGP